MIFEELKVGDKFIFDYDIENDIEHDICFGRILFMKTKHVKDKYYSYNAVMLTGENKGKLTEMGKFDEIILIE